MARAMNDWWRGAVIYQIYPRSFADANGDGIGDLAGITEKLDHVASLGVDGVWLSPFFTSPMVDFGYDVADYCDVDPMFGTLADFDALVERAHDLGLKVIIDQVYSHTSDAHPWFRESRRDTVNDKADWYVWAEPKRDGTAPNNWMSHFGGPAWTWDARRRQYYLHNFAAQQPDLNFHNPRVRQAILDVARFWLDRGVDGFRLDTANIYVHDAQLRDNPPADWTQKPFSTYHFQRHIHNLDQPEAVDFARDLRVLTDTYSDRMMVAEIVTERGRDMSVELSRGNDRYHTAYSFVFLDRTFSAPFIRQTVADQRAAGPDSWPGWAFSNHDSIRVASRWGGLDDARAKAKCLLAMLVTLRGTAFVYQGEELGLPQGDIPFDAIVDPVGRAFWPDDKGRDGCRTPIPWTEAPGAGFSTDAAAHTWLPVDAAHLPLSVAAQDRDPDSVLTYFRALMDWRGGVPAIRTGEIAFLETDEPVLAFTRTGAEGAWLCAFNLSERRVAHPLAGDAALGDMALGDAAPISRGGTVRDGGLDLAQWGGLIVALGGGAQS